MIKKPLSSWKIMTSVLNDYKPTEEEIARINGFFFVRWLSCDVRTINVSNFFNRYYIQIPMKQQYTIAEKSVTGVGYIQMPRGEKIEDKAIDNLERFYKINTEAAIEYFKMLPEDKLEYFRTLYPD